MKKVFIGLMCILLLSGCGVDKKLKETYEGMKIGESIDSYQLDLRIYGTYSGRTVNEIVKIDNYKNTQLKIDYVSNNNKINKKEDEKNLEEGPKYEDTALYIIDGTKYRYKDGEYQKINEDTLYSNTDLYLEALNNVVSKTALDDEKIAEETYKVYEVMISKKSMQDVLKDSILSELKINKDVRAKVWFNSNNQVYKILYYLTESTEDGKKLEISANYFRINMIGDMSGIIK